MTQREKLIQLRDKAGISQQTLANELEVTRQTVSRWESGKTTPSDKALQALAAYYQVSAAWLAGECEEPTEEPSLACMEIKEEAPQNKKSRKTALAAIGTVVFVLICFVCFCLLKPSDQKVTKLDDMERDYFELSDENSFEFEWGE